MSAVCACGTSIDDALHGLLGCIECGGACCRACGLFLESVTYCSFCASALLETPAEPTGALIVVD